MIDLHSHILPAVDDGPVHWKDSLDIARGMAALGFTHTFATPHYIIGQYDSGAAKIRLAINDLQSRIDQAGIKLKILPGNEVYFDSALTSNDQLTDFLFLGQSKTILIEAPFSRFDINLLYKIAFILQNRGLNIILAHPERAAELINDFGLIQDIHERGIKLQLNITSLIGKYGPKSQKTAEKLIETNMVYGIGTDIHRLEQMGSTITQALTIFSKIAGQQKISDMNKTLRNDLGLT